jgi:hypothetical protein
LPLVYAGKITRLQHLIKDFRIEFHELLEVQIREIRCEKLLLAWPG